jgi:hypothetical protein
MFRQRGRNQRGDDHNDETLLALRQIEDIFHQSFR